MQTLRIETGKKNVLFVREVRNVMWVCTTPQQLQQFFLQISQQLNIDSCCGEYFACG